MFTDLRPLLEFIGSSGQIEKKSLRMSLASLKQNLEDGEVDSFSWIVGTEIVVDIFTKQGSEREVLGEIVEENKFRHALNEDNLVVYENEEIKMKNEATKMKRDDILRGRKENLLHKKPVGWQPM